MTDVKSVLQNVTKSAIKGFIKMYYMDFRMCGYEESLQQLNEMIIWWHFPPKLIFVLYT